MRRYGLEKTFRAHCISISRNFSRSAATANDKFANLGHQCEIRSRRGNGLLAEAWKRINAQRFSRNDLVQWNDSHLCWRRVDDDEHRRPTMYILMRLRIALRLFRLPHFSSSNIPVAVVSCERRPNFTSPMCARIFRPARLAPLGRRARTELLARTAQLGRLAQAKAILDRLVQRAIRADLLAQLGRRALRAIPAQRDRRVRPDHRGQLEAKALREFRAQRARPEVRARLARAEQDSIKRSSKAAHL